MHSSEYQLLLNMRQEAIRILREAICKENECTTPAAGVTPFQLVSRPGCVGRPRVLVNIDQIELLRSAGFTWQEVADAVQVSRSTLWRRLSELNVSTNKYSDICEDELDIHVRRLQRDYPNCGQVMIRSLLQQQGMYVQRYRVRESMRRLDPLQTAMRWQQVVRRRSYSVTQANSLWHIDGHHSLIRWRFVVHGGIDGFSQTVVHLSGATNNSSETVYKLFQNAIEEYGVPRWVRSDKGGEDMLVCRFMITYRGTGRGSHLAGSSVHNQRIEHLWHDVYRCVCSTYHEMFYNMEAIGMLNVDSEMDLYVLHCVFLPLLNASLDNFAKAWNLHPIRTENNWSPKKMWLNSIIQANDEPDTVSSDFGIDCDGPMPEEDIVTVVVPETVSPLDDDEIKDFMSVASPDSAFTSIDEGVSHYVHCKSILEHKLEDLSD